MKKIRVNIDGILVYVDAPDSSTIEEKPLYTDEEMAELSKDHGIQQLRRRSTLRG